MLKAYIRTLIHSIRPVWPLRRDRLWEVDALRGIAILMMVVYHLAWDLYGLAGWDIPIYGLFWSTWQRITASLFIGLVGVSMYLRAQRLRAKGGWAFRPYLLRGLVIFSWGMVITLVTYLYQPGEQVRFGILHFIGVSILLAYPLLRFPLLGLPLGLLVLLLPRLISWRHGWSWLEWVGLVKNPHPAFDYFPLIPWFGVVLLGLFLARVCYPRGRRLCSRWPAAPPKGWAWLPLAGQNSLLIYLLHQPVIILLLTVLGIIPGA
ncbi:MAG: DUF1624 domain-containing protein [Chloroflexi bacterium]|nr:DUF1624 domain-containing protein [Chloroflexota bacterium]